MIPKRGVPLADASLAVYDQAMMDTTNVVLLAFAFALIAIMLFRLRVNRPQLPPPRPFPFGFTA